MPPPLELQRKRRMNIELHLSTLNSIVPKRYDFILLVSILPMCQSAWGEVRPVDANSLSQQSTALDRQYATALQQLAGQIQDPAGARMLAAWLPSQPDCGDRLFVASDIYSPLLNSMKAANVSGGGQPSVLSSWQNDWQALREKMAQQYYLLAIEACQQNQVGLALRLATRALRENPDHPKARRLLGYQRVGDLWGGGYAARMFASGRVWNPQYGWVRSNTIERWNAGQRPRGRQWISVEQDQRHHQTIEEGWHVRSDHYEIVTNQSRSAAVDLVKKMETVYQIWQQLFGEYFLSSQQLLQRATGQLGPGSQRKPFQVRYYRSRHEYNDHLRHLQPRIDRTLGIYFDSLRQTHFFYGPEQDAGILTHEAVHQLFQETRGNARKRSTSQLAIQANAWVIEGVACYFESLIGHPLLGPRNTELPNIGQSNLTDRSDGRSLTEFFTIGTPDAGRLPAARHRRLVDSFYLPLREFSALNARELQQHAQIARLYSQAAGVATFLMYYQGGIYRQSLVQYLQAVYAGRDKSTTLAEATGQPFEKLDEQYTEFLQRLP